MKILTFTRFAINSFVALVLSVASLSFQAEASQGQTVFIPISVGDITTFIPIMPSSSTGSVASTTTDGSYNLNWSAVTNASYYQIIITDEDGKKRIIKVFGTSYDLAGLSLGSNTIEVQACNANHQCGVGYLAGTVSRSSKVTYQHTDMLGTPVMETDEAGQIASRSVYEPFGKRLGGEKEGIGYTGHLQDEDLGLTYMQARYYDPLIGRFYSNDPVGWTPKNPVMSFNRYLYVNNNPYKYTDPDGEFLFLLPVIGAISGGYTAYQAAGDMGASGNAQILAGLGGALAGAFTGGTTAVASKAVAFTAKTVAKTAVSSSLAATGKLTAGAVTGAISSGSGQAIGDALSDLSQGNKPDVDMNKVASKAVTGAGDGMLGAIPGAPLTLSPAKKLVADTVGVGVVAAKKELESNE